MKQRAWLKLIDDFNDNEHDFIIDNFGEIETFFEVLKKKDLFHLIDPEVDGSEAWINEYLLYMYIYNKESFYNYVVNYLDDVELKGGVFYLQTMNRDDLSELFCHSSRNYSSRDIADKLLEEDGDFEEYFGNTTDDVYRDVIKELDNKNTQILYEYIVSSLSGVEIEPLTDVLEVIAEEQGHPEYVDVNAQTVIKIVNDEESMKTLLHGQLYDLKNDLYNVHSNSYNSAYYDEMWYKVWNELQIYFNGKGESISKKLNHSISRPYFEIEIRDFEKNILKYLKENKGYGNTGTLYYQGTYINVLKSDDFDCLQLNINDYPDYRKVDNYINEFFKDYL